jgi:hypothetical protein
MICSICLDEFINSSNKNISQNFCNNIKMKCCKNHLHAECLARLIYCNHVTCPYCRGEIILNDYFTDDSFNLVTNNLYEYDYSINPNDYPSSISFSEYRYLYWLNLFNLMCEYLRFLRIKNKILYNLSYKEYTFCGIKKNIPSIKRFINLVLIHIIFNIHYFLLFVFVIISCHSAITYSINNPKPNYHNNHSPNLGNIHYSYQEPLN